MLQEKFGKDWEQGKIIEGDITEATLDGLKEGTQYEFRIRAINKAGPGEPSDTTKPIIAKSRFGKKFFPLVLSKLELQTYSLRIDYKLEFCLLLQLNLTSSEMTYKTLL